MEPAIGAGLVQVIDVAPGYRGLNKIPNHFIWLYQFCFDGHAVVEVKHTDACPACIAGYPEMANFQIPWV